MPVGTTTVAPESDLRDDADRPVLLFLPARNEAPTVGAVLAAAPTRIEHRGTTIAVRTLVVDDGSVDDTGAVARSAGAAVITTEGLGLGAAVRIGLAHARSIGATAAVFCDADLEYDTAALVDLVEPILDGRADYVVGSRFLGGRRRMRSHRTLGNHLLTMVVRALTTRWRTTPLTDGQSGYRALSRDAIAAATIEHDYNYAQVLTLDLLGKGFRYHEVPIDYAHRQIGRSFVRLPTYLCRVGPAVWRVWRRHRTSAAAPQSSTTKSRNPSRASRQAC